VGNDIAVYTAIAGARDRLKTDQCRDGADFYAFVDFEGPDDLPTDSGWRFDPVCRLFTDPRRNAKIHKILSHLYLPGYRYSIWMDGSVSLRVPAADLVRQFLDGADVAMFRHRWRRCAYDVAANCARLHLDYEGLIAAQVAQLERRGWQRGAGQHECAVILRRHTYAVERFNALWWADVCRFSRRDQISVEWAAAAAGLRIADIPGNVQHNDFFTRRPHARKM
jgi:hypothetical protein